MELGGNAPVIVFDDADLDTAVRGTIAAKYRNSGQTCVCANRVYVQEGIHDAFVEELAKQVGEMTLGDGALPDVQLGPLINTGAVAKVEGLLVDALDSGATRVPLGPNFVEGTPASSSGEEEEGGHFVPPVVLTGVTSDMAIAQAEIFGP
jgi:succinate-semialdehyde dehydrogenase / glutarate-semialdehyde dehydrogenase